MLKAMGWLVLGLALQLTTGEALAQFGARGATSSVSLAQQKSVQDELKLTEDQVEKLKQIVTKMRESFGGGGAGGDREEARKKFAEAAQVAEKDLNGVLSADQSKRLKEVTLQQMGLMALARADVAKEVGLTDEQLAKVKELTEALATEMRSQFQAGGGGGDREEARKKIVTLRKETGDKLFALLTDDQKKSWEKLLGEPFKGALQSFGGNRPRNQNAQ